MIVALLLKYKKLLGFGALFIGVVLASYTLGVRSAKPLVEIREKIVERVVEVEKAQVLTHKKTLKSVDGSIHVEEWTETKTDKKTVSDKDTDKKIVESSGVKYKLGLYAQKSLREEVSYGLSIGYRTAPFWFEGGYNPKNKELVLGLSVEL